MTHIDKKNLRVLIADDEVEFASTIVTRLKLRNFAANMVNSGKDALAAIEEEQPDVLLLDLKMPDLDGLEVLASLKENYPALAVIILTGHGSFEAGLKGMELGAYDYIMKPVDLNLLITKIEGAFEAASAKARDQNPEHGATS
jgi:DNA-binding NtrC family response regulator